MSSTEGQQKEMETTENAPEETPATTGEAEAKEEDTKVDEPATSEPAEAPTTAVVEEGEGAKPDEETAAAPEAKTDSGDEEPKPKPEPVEEQKQEEEEEEEDDEEEPDDGVPRVLVTGASGYIASMLVKQLLEDGRFRVRGTVRSLKNKDKIQPLRDLVPNPKYPLRLVKADLQKPDSWPKAVNSCTYVFHMASPFPAGTVSEEEVIGPAVNGVTNVFKACAEAGTVKRVILTSSVAAISSGVAGSPDKPPDYVYSEVDWSVESACNPYVKSKLLAERAAWDFVKNLDDDKKFELVVMNPGYVQGPFNSRSSGEGTKLVALSIMNGKMSALPEIYFQLVDVRDVVAAHIAGLEKPEAVGNRYALVTDTIGLREVARIIADEFRPQGYKISTTSMPKIGMWMFKLFSSDARRYYPMIGKLVRYNNTKFVNELGISPRSIKESIIDTCYSLIELGDVRKTPGYLGHPSTRPPPPVEKQPDEEQPKEDDTGKETGASKGEEPKEKEEETKEEAMSKEEPAVAEPAKEGETEKAEPPKEEESEPAANDKEGEGESAQAEPPKEGEGEPPVEAEAKEEEKEEGTE